jgi:hypothetical protein
MQSYLTSTFTVNESFYSSWCNGGIETIKGEIVAYGYVKKVSAPDMYAPMTQCTVYSVKSCPVGCYHTINSCISKRMCMILSQQFNKDICSEVTKSKNMSTVQQDAVYPQDDMRKYLEYKNVSLGEDI